MSIFSQLPNDLDMDIIKLADGGLTNHTGKFNIILKQIRNEVPIYYYKDGMGNDCPQYFGEGLGGNWGINWDTEEEEEEE